MATIKAIIFANRPSKNGQYNIKIAVSHHQATFYIATPFYVDSTTQFKNGQVTRRQDAHTINIKLRELLNNYSEKLFSISNLECYEPVTLKKLLENRSNNTGIATFQCVCNDYIAELVAGNRKNYAVLLERNNRYFTAFTKGDILLQDITPELIEAYSIHIRRTRKISETTIGMLMKHTRTIINRAIRKRLVKYEIHPFIDFSIPSAPVREIDVPVDVFNRIRQSNPNKRTHRIARDLFCLSFYLGGINLIDLLSIDFSGDEIAYTRTKTKLTKNTSAVTRLSIQPEARAIIDNWINRRSGRLDFGYKFSYQNFSRYVSRMLAALSKDIGIKEKVLYYSARKSFAQYATDIGIPDSVIDYCLGHSDKGRGVIRYYSRIRRHQADAAISKVIDYVHNPEKYSDYIKLKRDIMMMQG